MQRYLEALCEETDNQTKDRLQSATLFLDSILVRERANRRLRDDRRENLVDVVRGAYWNQRVFDVHSRLEAIKFIPLILETQPGTTIVLNASAADDLGEIVFEAIENCLRYSEGAIEVSVIEEQKRGRTLDTVLVRDGGPSGSGCDDEGRGLRSMRRRAATNGWEFDFVLGDDRRGSELKVVLTRR